MEFKIIFTFQIPQPALLAALSAPAAALAPSESAAWPSAQVWLSAGAGTGSIRAAEPGRPGAGIAEMAPQG